MTHALLCQMGKGSRKAVLKLLLLQWRQPPVGRHAGIGDVLHIVERIGFEMTLADT